MSSKEMQTSNERAFYSDRGISVIVPVYNSEGTIDDLAARFEAILSEVASTWEIVMVNDGSRDESWRRIEGLAKSNSSVRGTT